MWVVSSIPFAYGFDFFEEHAATFLQTNHDLGPKLLLDIPNNISDSIMHPNFNKINTRILDNCIIYFNDNKY